MATKRAVKKSRAKKLSKGKKMKGVKTLTEIPVPYYKVYIKDAIITSP